MLYRVFFLYLFSILSIRLQAQENNIAIGNWRVHLPYYSMKTIAMTGTRAYVANGSSIYYFDKEDNSVDVLSKYTGLNDVKVSRLGYNSTESILMIGYESGNIDLIKGNELYNMNDILRAQGIAGSRKINHFFMHDEFVYISGDFGVTLYNLKKKEVKESYLTLTGDLTMNMVFASTLTTDKDSIFLATSKGVMAARVSQAVNLLDFSNWYTFQASDSIDAVNVSSVCAYNGTVYAAVQGKGVYYYNGSKWRKTSLPAGDIYSLSSMGSGILACIDTAVFRITAPNSWTSIFYKDNITPTEAYMEEDNTLWLSCFGGGMVRHRNNTDDIISPNGPFVNQVFKLEYFNNNMLALAGGYSSLGLRTYFGNWHSIFENNTSWVGGYAKYPLIPNTFRDFVGASYNKNNSTLYFSVYGDGLAAVNDDGTTTIYTELNSPLKRSGATQTGDLLVGQTAIDTEGNLWVPTRLVNSALNNLHKLSPDGTWTSYKLTSNLAKHIIGVTIDDFDNKWIKAAGASETGIIVFNEKQNLSRTLINATGQGMLPDARVHCVTKDKKGTIYVGTDKGIAVCYDPSAILTSGVDLVTPIYDGFPILFERIVQAIEVDGGNRKWVGTNDGLWLFNEDLTEVLLYFNTDNSPLLSDDIMDIKIHERSGEVFFATPEGIISYRGTATTGDENYSDVKVFPNPVKPGFSGLVGISGLASDVTVKITDVAGNMVYETKAQGGTAVWNVKDYNGKRASTGVYLIFCSAADGSSKFVSKIAVIE